MGGVGSEPVTVEGPVRIVIIRTADADLGKEVIAEVMSHTFAVLAICGDRSTAL